MLPALNYTYMKVILEGVVISQSLQYLAKPGKRRCCFRVLLFGKMQNIRSMQLKSVYCFHIYKIIY